MDSPDGDDIEIDDDGCGIFIGLIIIYWLIISITMAVIQYITKASIGVFMENHYLISLGILLVLIISLFIIVHLVFRGKVQ